LRGPQGTLAGRNSIGGAIKLFSRKPSGDGSGSVSVTHGSYNRMDVRATGDFGITDSLFMRVAGSAKSRDGYMDRLDYACTHPGSGLTTLNVGTGCKLGTLGGTSVVAGRASLRWLASDDIEVNFSGDVVNDTSEAGASLLTRATNSLANGVVITDTNDPRFIQQNGVPYDCRFVPWGPNSCDPNRTGSKKDAYISYATFIDSLDPTTQRPYKPFVVPPIQHLKQWGVGSTVDWTLGENYALKWIGSWREYDSSWAQDVDGSPLPSQQLLQTLVHRQWTQELRFNGSAFDGRLDYTLGGFYFDQEGTLEARVDLNYAGWDFIHGPDETPATSKAVFSHAEFHATDALTFIAGIRYTEDEKDYLYQRRNPDGTTPGDPAASPAGACPPGPPPITPSSPPNCAFPALRLLETSYSGDRTDWRIGANYRFNEALMAYAQVSTGYKGGGVNPRPFFPWQVLTFKPETMTTYEVGWKSDLLGNRLRLNGAVFFNDYKDIILTLVSCDVAPPLPAAPCLLPANVGAADVTGLELEANWRLGRGFSLDASVSALDFKYTSLDPQTGMSEDMLPPGTPEQKYSAGLLWEGNTANGSTVLARLDWSFQSEIHSSAINSPFTRVAPYGVANLRVGWRGADNNWEAALEVNNVTDRLYFLANQDWSQSAGSTTYTPALPRTWGVTLKRNF
ncbi:MAG TPA: TonB-dependent receptor, partial [Steroidobacteraceae bacterium]|nr:TonB-dependent receptor [Steroidobacteraceae bacterium]